MKLKFLGTRGGVPVSGADKSFGNSTSCVSVALDGVSYIFDAGNGILNFETDLKTNPAASQIRIFLSHYHFDHLLGFPFFQPLYSKKFDIRVHLPTFGNIRGIEALQKLVSPPLFPVDLAVLGEHVTFLDFEPGELISDGDAVSVETKLFNHPGGVCAYKLVSGSKSIVYLSDVENAEANTIPDSVEFCVSANLLVIDSSYSDDEIVTRRGWGHFCISDIQLLAKKLPKTAIYLFHHEPSKSDERVEKDSFELRSRHRNVLIAQQGDEIEIQ